jgi:hypothetical protein
MLEHRISGVSIDKNNLYHEEATVYGSDGHYTNQYKNDKT